LDPHYNDLVATEGNVANGTMDPDRNCSLLEAQAFLQAIQNQNLGLGNIIYVANEFPFYGTPPKPMGATQLLPTGGPNGLLYPSNTEQDGNGKLLAPTDNDQLDLVVNVANAPATTTQANPAAGSLLAKLAEIPPPPALPIPASYIGWVSGVPTLVVNIKQLKIAMGM
jgi:hypothetical protein